MIDDELYRQGHRKEFEDEWMKKNRRAVLSRISSEGFDDVVFGDDNDNPGFDEVNKEGDKRNRGNDQDYATFDVGSMKEDFRQHAKDVKLAESSPERYCADRK